MWLCAGCCLVKSCKPSDKLSNVGRFLVVDQFWEKGMQISWLVENSLLDGMLVRSQRNRYTANRHRACVPQSATTPVGHIKDTANTGNGGTVPPYGHQPVSPSSSASFPVEASEACDRCEIMLG